MMPYRVYIGPSTIAECASAEECVDLMRAVELVMETARYEFVSTDPAVVRPQRAQLSLVPPLLPERWTKRRQQRYNIVHFLKQAGRACTHEEVMMALGIVDRHEFILDKRLLVREGFLMPHQRYRLRLADQLEPTG